MLNPYDKPPLTFDEQLDLLAKRGLVIDDRAQAFRILASTSYYRLSAYWYPFRIRDDDGNVTDTLEPETNSSTIIRLYEFDRHLRLAVMDAIERVEIAVRTRLTYQLAHAYGTFGHSLHTNFHPGFRHTKWLCDVEEESEHSKEAFISHYRETYEGFPKLPIWMATEVMSLGCISVLYGGLKHEDKKPISEWFQVHHKKLAHWFHVLTYIRNTCAHHGRLWNRELAIRPSSKTRNPLWKSPLTPRTDRIFIILLMLRHLLAAIPQGGKWQKRCSALLTPIADNPRWRESMGLPENWRNHPLWVRPDGVDASP